jgi:chloramphenicol 3-O-phosphotransferase
MASRESVPTHEPALIVISGNQDAGKTTTSQALARRLARCALVAGDEMQGLIVSGGVWPEGQEMSAEARLQLDLRLSNACRLALAFLDAGFTVVLEDSIHGLRLSQLLQLLSGRRFYFVMLNPSPAAIRRREKGRGTFDDCIWLHEEIQTKTPRIGLWIDNSDLTPDETVQEILARVWTEGVVEAGQLRV